jgi:hypothetical protein
LSGDQGYDLRARRGKVDGGQGGVFAEATVDDEMVAAGDARSDRGHEAAHMPGRRARHSVQGRREAASDERVTAGIVLAGERSARNWASGKAARFDAFDAKAEAIALKN